MNKRYLIPILVILILSFISCKDECEDRTIQAIDDFILKAIPYENGSYIEFTNSLNETIALKINRDFSQNIPGYPLVCEDVLEMKLNKPNGELYIETLIRGGISSNLLQWIIFDKNIEGPIIQFVVNKDNTMGILDSNDGSAIFHDSIELNGQSYSNVLQIIFPEVNTNWMKNFYYNKDIGIIMIETHNGYRINHK